MSEYRRRNTRLSLLQPMMELPDLEANVMKPAIVDARTVFLLSVVILVQHIITGWVVDYGADASVVSYVSFAGTLISIILAVLAIVYAYYQNFAQQRDSYNIASQVDLLRRVVEEIRDSEHGLATEVRQLHDLRKMIDESATLTRETRVEAQAMRTEIRQIIHEKAQTGAPVRETMKEEDKVELATRLVAAATPMQLCIYYAYCLAEDHDVDPLDVDSEVVEKCARAVPDWIGGIAWGTLLIARDLGVLPMNIDEPVPAYFKSKVFEAVGAGKGDHDEALLRPDDIRIRFSEIRAENRVPVYAE